MASLLVDLDTAGRALRLLVGGDVDLVGRRRGLTLRVVGAAGIPRRVLEITGAAGVLVGGADTPDANSLRRTALARRRP